MPACPGQVGALVDAADIGAAARSVDAVCSSIEKIASVERHVRGKIDEIQNTADPKERRRLLIELNDECSVLPEIDVISGELPVLYDLLVNPGYAGAWGSNLIELCDNLLAKSYDWDVQTYPSRVSFRENLALVWAQAAQIVELACGVTNTGEDTDELDGIDEMTRRSTSSSTCGARSMSGPSSTTTTASSGISPATRRSPRRI